MLLGYYLSFFAYHDYRELRDKAAAAYIQTGQASEATRRILWQKAGYPQSFIDLERGTYPVVIRYVLPGEDWVTTEREFGIGF